MPRLRVGGGPAPLLLILLVGASGGCGPGGGESACSNLSVPSCSTSAPSFTGEVSGLIQNRCAGCHGPGGVQANRPFTSYAQIKAQSAGMFSQLYGFCMPPADAPRPTESERETMLAWFACGAPEN